MHRDHHLVENNEASSNFAFNQHWWNRYFGTCREQSRAGHQNMAMGIHRYHETKQVSWLPGMRLLLFTGKINSYVNNRRQWRDDNNQEEKILRNHIVVTK